MNELARWWVTEQVGVFPAILSRALPGALSIAYLACAYVMRAGKKSHVVSAVMALSGLMMMSLVELGIPAIPARHCVSFCLLAMPLSVIHAAFRVERAESKSVMEKAKHTAARAKGRVA
jgi:hypothetical protein